MAVVEERFRVMASEARVLLVDPAPSTDGYARRRLAELERRWSRFIPDSDVSRLNHARPGETVEVSTDTRTLIARMREAYRSTGGRFDPTMLRQIIAAGYDASIDAPGERCVAVELPAPDATLLDVDLDVDGALPAGLAIDPGGIGKGLAADLVVGELMARGCSGALVSIGGDLAVAGAPPTADGWVVAVADPLEAAGAAVVCLAIDGGGVATSSTVSRQWRHRGRRRHHLLDPRTGASVATDLAAVTVVAPTGWQAEAHATAAVLEGSAGAIGYVTDRGLSGVAVTHAGDVTATPDIELR